MAQPEPAEKFYIQSSGHPADERTRVLKQGETFGVFDRSGSIAIGGRGELGIFHQGTRFLSQLELTVGGEPLLALSSASTQDSALILDLTNPDIHRADQVVLKKDSLHLFGVSLLWHDAYYLRLQIRNYDIATADLDLRLTFAA